MLQLMVTYGNHAIFMKVVYILFFIDAEISMIKESGEKVRYITILSCQILTRNMFQFKELSLTTDPCKFFNSCFLFLLKYKIWNIYFAVFGLLNLSDYRIRYILSRSWLLITWRILTLYWTMAPFIRSSQMQRKL